MLRCFQILGALVVLLSSPTAALDHSIKANINSGTGIVDPSGGHASAGKSSTPQTPKTHEYEGIQQARYFGQVNFLMTFGTWRIT